MDPAKVEVILKWHEPCNVKDLCGSIEERGEHKIQEPEPCNVNEQLPLYIIFTISIG